MRVRWRRRTAFSGVGCSRSPEPDERYGPPQGSGIAEVHDHGGVVGRLLSFAHVTVPERSGRPPSRGLVSRAFSGRPRPTLAIGQAPCDACRVATLQIHVPRRFEAVLHHTQCTAGTNHPPASGVISIFPAAGSEHRRPFQEGHGRNFTVSSVMSASFGLPQRTVSRPSHFRPLEKRFALPGERR